MTKYQIAKKIGVSSQAVYAWYSGKNIPSMKHLVELSKILNIPIQDVLPSLKAPEKKVRK